MKRKTHEDRRSLVCILCCEKVGTDGRSINKDMEELVSKIFSDYQSQKPYLPAGSCSKCRVKVSKLKKNGKSNEFVSNIDYLDIATELRNLPMATRDFKSQLDCCCQLCIKVKSGFTPEKSETKAAAPLVEEKEKVCLKCLSPIGRGHRHSKNTCNDETYITNVEKKIPTHVQQKWASRIIDKASKNSDGQSVLNSGGRQPKLVSVGPVAEPIQIPHSVFLNAEKELGTSGNVVRGFAKILRRDTGNRKIVEPNLTAVLVEQHAICNEYFHVDESIPLVNKEGGESKTPVVLCNDVDKYIDFHKTSHNWMEKNLVYKLGMDGGKGSFKVTLEMIEKSDPNHSDNLEAEFLRARSSDDPSTAGASSAGSSSAGPSSAGPSSASSSSSSESSSIPIKGLASSLNSLVSSDGGKSETPDSFLEKVKKSKPIGTGVKQLLILALGPGVKESHENLKLILEALKIFNLKHDFSIASDMKLYSILLGIQPHSSTYPCIWCEGKKCEYDHNAPLRTLGSCREYARKFKEAVARAESIGKKPPLPKDGFFCSENEPLLPGLDATEIIDLLPPPELHLMTGITFHIFKTIAKEWGVEKAYKWIRKYVGKVDPTFGFKGNQARKFLKLADKMALARGSGFPRKLMKYIRVLKAFDAVVASCFGKVAEEGYQAKIQTFEKKYMALNISVTPKVHCVFRHVQEFCERNNCGLGVYSEQNVEASHYDFDKVDRWYPTNPDTDPKYNEKILKALSRYNGLRLPILQYTAGK